MHTRDVHVSNLFIYLVFLYDAPKCKALWMQGPVQLRPIHYESYFGV